MPEQVDVYYEGWGERWRWGRLISTTLLTGRPQIAFEYSNEAEVAEDVASDLIDRICDVARRFASLGEELHPGAVRPDTLRAIQQQIDRNVALLR